MAYDLVTGDTLPTLRVSVKDEAGASFDMTGMTAVFRWENAAGVMTDHVGSIAADVASYQFMAGDIVAPRMRIELEVTNSAGKTITPTNLIVLSVREQLG